MNHWCEQMLRECMVCHYIHDTWNPAEADPPPPILRACYTALSPDFGAMVGFCAEHIGWMSDYSLYHDTITKLNYGEWL